MTKPSTPTDWKDFLDEKAAYYEHPRFVADDPIQVPHRYRKKEDVEIAGFLTASIAWGNRKSIINSANRMMTLLEDDPYHFVMHHTPRDLKRLDSFVHRTFNGIDLQYFVTALRDIYRSEGSLEQLFHPYAGNLQTGISRFKQRFFTLPHPPRTTKHLSDPEKNSAAKRINMFLRWMVRSSGAGVDFGLWTTIPPSRLSCPLDVHSGNVARKLGLLARKQNNAKALTELDSALRKLNPDDPVKYDFALFGLGMFEKF